MTQPTDTPTIHDVLAWSDRARMFIASHTLVSGATGDAVDAINRLTELARRGLDSPPADDVRWAILNDPIANAAYNRGRQDAR